ncbi:Dabb family protein [Coraliomargarita akajimensis]|uniref:Stress responsive alpha-beta barrel domain protein n=1 Tax=Coraliomargarita akajimensis (strain DSM 45221 / IAM 15411 / JCM 23193 / KCTC 12865 / 04OKA010-24) TaxID=583355 RepID=D5EKJ4_CORAD|nr:Dabb family protein [Coraliomargarita akajimensis]ADE54901.1 Stress responsive alpha-beta barrel domain protein [Coraliomargarita akajimensis DSM 45221]
MLVHTVLFWLNKDVDGPGQTDFRIALESLKSIETAEAVYIGVPAPTEERPVVDTSYDFALTCIFKSIADHDAYQDHPIHHQFLAENKEKFKRVKVFDAQ